MTYTFILRKQCYFAVSDLKFIGHGNPENSLESPCTSEPELRYVREDDGWKEQGGSTRNGVGFFNHMHYRLAISPSLGWLATYVCICKDERSSQIYFATSVMLVI
jgi:hypothetical protein